MEHHNVNAGVVVLSTTLLQNSRENQRLDIEDNIGEGIHIHYKNLRFDLTIRDFIEFAKAVDTAVNELYGSGREA